MKFQNQKITETNNDEKEKNMQQYNQLVEELNTKISSLVKENSNLQKLNQ